MEKSNQPKISDESSTFKFDYIKSKKFKQLLYLQINNKKEFIERSIDEWKSIHKFIDSPSKILDIGCGLGRSSIFIKNKMDLDSEFYMADFTGVEFNKKSACGVHNNTDKIPYNDLGSTKEFCERNGLTNINILNLDNVPKIKKLTEIDLVYSFHCVGYHWDISKSFEEYDLENICSDRAKLIFGIRKHVTRANPTKEVLFFPNKLGSFNKIYEVEGKYLQNYIIYER